MLEIPAHKLNYITDLQLSYIGQKPLNVYTRKLKNYNDCQQIFNRVAKMYIESVLLFIVVIKIII